MCQLTLIKTSKLPMLQALLANQLVVNTRVTHQDGMGVAYFDKKYNGFFIRGTTPPSKNDKLWQEYIEELDSVRYPVIAHVRRASTYTTDKQESHLHPFYDADTGIVLAHNGTLEFLDEERRKKTEEEFPNMIDSQVFFQILLEEFKKNGELKKDERIVKSLQDAMSQFYGKFAFLLRLGKTYYVIRGESASLYKATIYDGEDRVGFVINTELDSLKEGLYFTLTVFKAQGKEYTVKVESLLEETIYKYTSYDLRKIGKIKQNEKPAKKWKTTQPQNTIYLDNLAPSARQFTMEDFTPNKEERKSPYEIQYGYIKKWMRTFGLTLHELDELFTITCGTPIGNLVSSDLRNFAGFFYRPLKMLIDNNPGGFKAKRRFLNRIQEHLRLPNRVHAYNKNGQTLQFPYFLEQEKYIHELEVYARKVNRERNKK